MQTRPEHLKNAVVLRDYCPTSHQTWKDLVILNAEELTTRTLVSIKNFVFFFITCITRCIFIMLFLVDRVAQSFMSSACGFPLLMLFCAASALSLRLCSRFVHILLSFLTERLGLFYHVLLAF